MNETNNLEELRGVSISENHSIPSIITEDQEEELLETSYENLELSLLKKLKEAVDNEKYEELNILLYTYKTIFSKE